MFSRRHLLGGLAGIGAFGSIAEAHVRTPKLDLLATPTTETLSESGLLDGHLGQTGFPAAVYAISATDGELIDAGDITRFSHMLKGGQIFPPGAIAAVSLYPLYFNAPDRMFAKTDAFPIRGKKRASIQFNLATRPDNSQLIPMGWSYGQKLFDETTLAPDVPSKKDFQVRSVQFNGSKIRVMENIKLDNGMLDFSLEIRFLLDANPDWERVVKTYLQKATDAATALDSSAILPAGAVAITAATLPAFGIAKSALGLFDLVVGGGADRVEKLFEYQNGGSTLFITDVAAAGPANVSSPGSVLIPNGLTQFVLVPAPLKNHFNGIVKNRGFVIDHTTSNLVTIAGDASLQAQIDQIPYVLIETQVATSASAAAASPTPSVAPPMPVH